MGSYIIRPEESPGHCAQIAEAAYLTPDNDPLKAHFTKLLNDTMDGLVQYYITGGYNNKYGDIQGFLMGYGEE